MGKRESIDEALLIVGLGAVLGSSMSTILGRLTNNIITGQHIVGGALIGATFAIGYLALKDEEKKNKREQELLRRRRGSKLLRSKLPPDIRPPSNAELRLIKRLGGRAIAEDVLSKALGKKRAKELLGKS